MAQTWPPAETNRPPKMGVELVVAQTIISAFATSPFISVRSPDWRIRVSSPTLDAYLESASAFDCVLATIVTFVIVRIDRIASR